ncbi:MAG: DUF3794 domain-containing protein, partial [Oscillospiraceae bacterium]|nr:DUF3794 domain-containing protein [Oscillospiraceae bacterium]
MENFNPVKERFRVHSLINEGGCEQGMDTEITLPEYFPDIVKILKCYVTPVIGSHSAEGERVSADGMITVKIVYAGEENRLYSYDTGNPFSCFCDIGSVNEESIVFPKASVQSVSCRAVSQRKFELHTTVKINFKAYKTLDTEVVTGVEGCGAEEKTALVSVKNSVKMIEKNISLVESVDIDDGKPSVSRLIKTHGAAVINEVKIIPNKMMVKGEVMAKSVYCGDESPGGFFIQPNSMPFNEIIEVQGLKETDNCDIAIRTVNIETAVKSKLNGDMRTLDHNIKMTFHINAEEVRELNCVTDAYSTEYDMNLERTAVDTVKSSENLFENFIAKGSVGMSDTAISGVSDVTCVECTKNVSVSDGCLFIRGKIYADIIYTSGDG